MIDISYINSYFPNSLTSNSAFQKHILKEYIQLMVLDHISMSGYINKLSFIGGTNLRIIKGIDRFSEDLDFDCKQLSETDFMNLTDSIILFLKRSGLNIECKDKPNSNLTAYRRNIYFPEFLFNLGLTGHKEERFLLKIEAQDQTISYDSEMKQVQKCGFFFSIPTPPDSILLSMKLSALLTRAKGRDFYDCMFLMQQTKPSYEFLSKKNGISSPSELKEAISKKLRSIDLNLKKKDFEHLLFNTHSAEKLLKFEEFINYNL